MACRRVDRILWIVADTVRADYLGYNGGHVRTANIDALAARSTVFDRHYAVSFPTVPARSQLGFHVHTTLSPAATVSTPGPMEATRPAP